MTHHDTVGQRTLVRAIESNAALRPQHVFIEYGAMHITHAAFAAAVRRVANGLLKAGIGAGQRVLALLPNCPEYLVVRFAVQRIGAVFVTCSSLYVDDEIRYQLEASGAVLAISDVESAARVRAIAAQVATVSEVLLVDAGRMDASSIGVNGWLSSCSDQLSLPFPDVDALSMLMYTSGTTARPKGVMFTHGNEMFSSIGIANAFAYTRFERLLHYFPLYHINGGLALLGPLILRGATMVMVPKFSASGFSRALVEQGITMAAMNATHIKMLLNQPASAFDAAHKVYRAQFALPLDLERRQEFSTRFGGITLVEAYGLTEGMGICIASPIDALWKPGSAGLPFPGYGIKLIDEHGAEVATGEPGQLLLQCQSRHGLTQGYFEDKDASAQLLRDGWLHTGDVGQLDEDGYFYFLERQKDMIKRSGFNVAAAEVERVLLSHASVREAAVVGIPDDMREEAIVAFVVAASGARSDAEQLRAHCATQLAPYKVPEHVVTLDAMPENFLGKVEKKLLREMARERFAGR
jgi:crotonobetaine/carnitine-CoA ligase